MEFLTRNDAISVNKENKTKVDYFIFDEYEIHLNTILPQAIQEWHYHTRIEEVILVTKGILTGKWNEGDVIHIKDIQVNEIVRVESSVHTFENRTNEEVDFIVFRLVLDGKNKRKLIKKDKVTVL